MPLETTGVRLPGETRQRIAKQASILGIAQSSFIRVLIIFALDSVEKNPAILLNRFKEAALPEKA